MKNEESRPAGDRERCQTAGQYFRQGVRHGAFRFARIFCATRPLWAEPVEAFSTSSTTRLKRARTNLTDARAIRNRRLGHLDLATSGQQVGLPSDPVVGDITRALAELRDILNALERHFDLPTFMYDQFDHPSGALTLLRRLKMAEAYEHHVAAGRVAEDEDDLRLPSA